MLRYVECTSETRRGAPINCCFTLRLPHEALQRTNQLRQTLLLQKVSEYASLELQIEGIHDY